MTHEKPHYLRVLLLVTDVRITSRVKTSREFHLKCEDKKKDSSRPAGVERSTKKTEPDAHRTKETPGAVG